MRVTRIAPYLRARLLRKGLGNEPQDITANTSQQPHSKFPIMEKDGKKNNIAFFHPDLGIGGAERLIIDAAVGLQNRGHKVVIFTSHCDPQHCFDEARDGMTLYSAL